ncbi:MAG TPA: HAMP domain-containing sensor histidine kinase [Streptosporangiaceae bacterium]|nr:HAMP domain-containing sensor histidine kinase [Streptosporangiaceae bacterium]
MASLSFARKTWNRLRRLSDRTPLRVKVLTAMLALVGVALVIISVAGVLVFRDYLTSRADSEVRQQFQLAVASAQSGQLHPSTVGIGGPYVTAWRLEGRQLEGQVAFGGRPLRADLPDVPVSLAWVNAHAGKLVTIHGLDSTDRWEVMVLPTPYYSVFGERQVGTLIVGVNLGDIDGSIARLAAIDAIVGAVLLLGLAAVGFAVVKASLRPLTDIERTAGQIAAGDLTRRVRQADQRTEVGRLAGSLNRMLEHIEAAFRARTASEEAARRSEEAARHAAMAANRSEDRMRRFIADASHELRTPLTAIRGYAEYYRQRGGTSAPRGSNGSGGGVQARPKTPPVTANGGAANGGAANGGAANGNGVADSPFDLDRMIARVEQEATRMGVLVDDLLLLARLDQQRSLEFRTVDMLGIAVDAMHDARVIAPDRAINLTVASPEAALVIGDEVGLRQVVGNLMNNAITHTPEGTSIDLTIRVADSVPAPVPPLGGPDDPVVILEVADHGAGLTAEQREHVFERFYRTDKSRTRKAGGTGLGLAIVNSMISTHGGRVWVDKTPGGGATFGFGLPLAPEARLG